MRAAGIILAGGGSRRMQAVARDKALVMLAGRPMIAHVIDRLGCACAISGNGDPSRFAAVGLPDLPVLPDMVSDAGPLGGVLAGMNWATAQGFSRIVTAAADTPFLPRDMAERLLAEEPAPVAIVTCGGRDHPTIAAWDVGLRHDLRRALDDGQRRPLLWALSVGAVRVDFAPGPNGGDPFFNVNTPDDLVLAERRACGQSQAARL